ncbi:MAG: S-layer homology domain-containing protein [Oscillibacter sp.]|nr:S-layer homology domain-containing protein [Oscillibacter sp.]
MDEDKKAKLEALANKVKEQAAQGSESAGDGNGRRGLFGNLFGNKPNANAQNAANTKPTATAANAKPTATGSVKPTTAAAGAKPTAAANAKPTGAASVKPTAAKKSVFTDVAPSAYYADAVEWAVQKGITSGTTPTTFTPNNPCHRGHAATFLWRSKGSPAPKSANNPFADVAADSPFYKAILWATENKIIEPKSANAYEPTAPCTRGEVLTYLLRAEGKSGATQADALKWASLKRLLAGFAGGAEVPCTRADIVTFLYRVKTT